MKSQNKYSVFIHQLIMSSIILFVLWGCDDEISPPSSSEVVTQNLVLNFEATVGSQPFQCGVEFSNLGSTNASLTFTDLRFFIHDIQIYTDNGQGVKANVQDDNIWQNDGVVLLDFEDGCDNGTAELNTRAIVTVPQGQYTGVSFRLGIPSKINSSETILEGRGSPFNQSSMYWSWRSGYKFIRIDTMQSFRFHLGSVGCDEDFSCVHENQFLIEIGEINFDADTITLDLKRMLENLDVTQNTADTPSGCMGEHDDPDCLSIFQSFGVPETYQQIVFSIR